MMCYYTTLLRIVLPAAMIAFAGCNSVPPSGVVGWRDPPSSHFYAPDLPILTSENKEVRFHEVREPVAIMVFVKATEPCDALGANVSRLSKRMKHLPVTIVQVSLPTEACSQALACSKSLPSSTKNVMCLSDISRMAWDAYKQPDANTLMLIDDNNKVIDIQPAGHSKALEDRAMAMAQDVYDDRFSDID